MLAEKNGLKSVWRSPGKTVLFLVLLLALTAILSLGLCIYSAVDGYLTDCDTYYRTIANLEYIGQEYNDNTVYDQRLAESLDSGELDLEAIRQLPGVLNWEPNCSALGIMEGLQRKDPNVYNPDAAVLVVGNLFWEGNSSAYMGDIRQCLYSQKDTTGKAVYISPLGLTELLESGHLDSLDTSTTRTYVFAGRYIPGENSYVWFLPEALTVVTEGQELHISPAMPLPGGELPEDSPYYLAAQAMYHQNNSVRVLLTEDLENYYPFHQQELHLTEGRSFTPEEYASGARVCVLSSDIAAAMEISVGDTVPLSVNFPEDSGIYDTMLTQPSAAEAYTVVGLFGQSNSYMDWVFIPDSPDYTPNPCPTGYAVGQFQLANDQAEAFEEAAGDLLPSGFRLTVYDQGYAVTAAPFQELLRVAQIFLAVCCLVILAVLALYGYLFVYRQREAAQTMFALGSGRLHVYRFFAAGSGAIALLASLLGAFTGWQLERRVLDFVAEFAQKYQAADLRYSSGSLSVSKELAFAPQTPEWLFFAGAGIMVVAALLACALFTGSALREKGKKRRKKQPHGPRHAVCSSRLSGPWKYPVLSIRRGGIRTAAAIAVALVIALFLGQLTATAGAYRNQLAAIEENTVIRGYLSDSKGLIMDHLVLQDWQLQEYYETGLIESMDISSEGGHYRFLGVRQDTQGNVYQVPCIPSPASSFVAETMQSQMAKEPSLISTTSMDNSPEFYYTTGAQVTWLPGYDERCLRGPDAAVCVLPTTMLEREGIELGSIIRLFLCTENGSFYNYDFYVVGSYVPQGASDTIYAPLTYRFPKDSKTGPFVERPGFPEDDLDHYTCNGVAAYFLSEASAAPFRKQYFSSAITQTSKLNFGYPGYDEWAFRNAAAQVCLISEDFMEAQGLACGSILELTDPEGFALEYTVVGTYEKLGDEIYDLYCVPPATAYVAMGDYSDNYAYQGEYEWGGSYTVTCESAIFTLGNTGDLTALKDALEALNVTSPGQATKGANRSYLVIDDKDFNGTVRSLQRQIQYLDALYKCLYVLVGLAGLTASYLLVASRKRELAIMRGLGAQPMGIFGAFFLEQLFLSLLGCCLGVGLWAALGRPMGALYLPLTAAFLACWALGSAASILHLLRSKALAVLSDRE